MGREKRSALGMGAGAHAKERHKRDRRGNIIDWNAPLPAGLVARPERPRVSSKHKSWFEFVENKDKKKKLEIEVSDLRRVIKRAQTLICCSSPKRKSRRLVSSLFLLGTRL
jgi:hypothetical protein